ncbi:MAG: oxidoreductase family protein [Acidobacteriota bacterium]
MSDTDADWLEWVRTRLGAETATPGERIQSLWSGYGEIRRVHLTGHALESVVVKRVSPPTDTDHPRGWNTSRSHERKLRSYVIEEHWYSRWAERCAGRARVPRCLGTQASDGQSLFVLEDLDDAGFPYRRQDATDEDILACLGWLADFHARFLGAAPEGLWPVGTYWHLETRPDELAATDDPCLRAAAPLIDDRLNQCRFQTFVHGDAKIANFCFPAEGEGVAAVDFQYVGGGCGMKDVAYFLSSCMSERECEARAEFFLDEYFNLLRAALPLAETPVDPAALEAEWRALYPIAWADFYRFLAGWSPTHWKIHGYSDRLTREVLATFDL